MEPPEDGFCGLRFCRTTGGWHLLKSFLRGIRMLTSPALVLDGPLLAARSQGISGGWHLQFSFLWDLRRISLLPLVLVRPLTAGFFCIYSCRESPKADISEIFVLLDFWNLPGLLGMLQKIFWRRLSSNFVEIERYTL